MEDLYKYGVRRTTNYEKAEFTMGSRIFTPEENEREMVSDWYRFQLLGNALTLPVRICSLQYLTTLVVKNNKLDTFPPELSNLTNLINLDASFNQITSIPDSVGDMTELRTLLLNDNRLNELPLKLGLLFNLKTLNIRNNHFISNIFFCPDENNESNVRNFLKNLSALFYQKNQITVPPNRIWRKAAESQSEFSFTLMSFNILCPKYATQSMYPYCPSWCLDWDYRRRGILEEILKYNADIVCLQELETLEYEQTFREEMQKQRYDSVFLAKSRTHTMDQNDKKNVDGCAIFWKTEIFSKLDTFYHEFSPASTKIMERPCTELLNRVMTYDNVAISVVLETQDAPKRKLCVTTGHIHWNPDYSDVKLVQNILWTHYLSENLQAHLSQHSQHTQHTNMVGGRQPEVSQMPVIFCGDFNSLPDSGVIEFMMKGSVPRNHADFLAKEYEFEAWRLSPAAKRALQSSGRLTHPFCFDRAYPHGAESGMRYSNYKYQFRGTIDYIFFSSEHFRLLGSLDQTSEEWLREQRVVGCPHVHMHSDHFSLFAELELNDSPKSSLNTSSNTKTNTNANASDSFNSSSNSNKTLTITPPNSANKNRAANSHARL